MHIFDLHCYYHHGYAYTASVHWKFMAVGKINWFLNLQHGYYHGKFLINHPVVYVPFCIPF